MFKFLPFQKINKKENQNAMKQQKLEHQIITLDEFTKEINELKVQDIN